MFEIHFNYYIIAYQTTVFFHTQLLFHAKLLLENTNQAIWAPTCDPQIVSVAMHSAPVILTLNLTLTLTFTL